MILNFFRIKLPIHIIALTTIFSCSKSPAYFPPGPEAEMTRSLLFPNQNGISKVAHYAGQNAPELKASLANDKLSILLMWLPEATNTAGEALAISISEDHLGTGLVKDYDYSGIAPGIVFTKYTYSYHSNNGNIWMNSIETGTGIRFEGVLHIQQHDKVNNTISGYYTILAKNILYDPTLENSGLPVDPLNQCNMELSGSFNNLEIQ